MQKISNGYLVVKGIINTKFTFTRKIHEMDVDQGLQCLSFKFQIVQSTTEKERKREIQFVYVRLVELTHSVQVYWGPMQQTFMTISTKPITINEQNRMSFYCL